MTYFSQKYTSFVTKRIRCMKETPKIRMLYTYAKPKKENEQLLSQNPSKFDVDLTSSPQKVVIPLNLITQDSPNKINQNL